MRNLLGYLIISKLGWSSDEKQDALLRHIALTLIGFKHLRVYFPLEVGICRDASCGNCSVQNKQKWKGYCFPWPAFNTAASLPSTKTELSESVTIVHISLGRGAIWAGAIILAMLVDLLLMLLLSFTLETLRISQVD